MVKSQNITLSNFDSLPFAETVGIRVASRGKEGSINFAVTGRAGGGDEARVKS